MSFRSIDKLLFVPSIKWGFIASCRAGFNYTNPSNDCQANKYLSSGFALLQHAIDTSIMQASLMYFCITIAN